MANVLEVLAADEINTLKEFSEDLDGILSCIAYDNPPMGVVVYIRAMNKCLKNRYGTIASSFQKAERSMLDGEPKLYTAVDCIISAYYGLQFILSDYRKDQTTPEERIEKIKEEAQDLLHSNLLFVEKDLII